MQILVHSDKNIAVDARVTRFIGVEVNRILKRFARRLTRVEVHLSDVNSHKFGLHDKKCLIEARPARHRPLTASSGGTTVSEAVGGALNKLSRSMETFFGRLKERHGDTPLRARREPVSAEAATPAAGAPKTLSAAANESLPEATATPARATKKKAIFQARRKSWPAR